MECPAKKLKIPIYIIIVLAAANINPLVDILLHPHIPYFDPEHLIIGGFMALFTIGLIVLFESRRCDDIGMDLPSSEGMGKYGIITGLIWTAVIASSLFWNINLQLTQTHQIALNEAKTVYEKDHLYYRWATEHHGVFVPITEKTRPNPYLRHLPEYKIMTTDGLALTLVNPEYMIRQVYEMQTRSHGTLGHITSLDPIRPENAADPWETKALKAFEKGITEVSSVQDINGEPYLRLMRPLITEVGCLRCHAQQGYRIGDIRGGVSVSIPLTPLLAISQKNIATYAMVHGLLWLLGIVAIFFGTNSMSRSIRRVEMAEARTRMVIENMLDGVITLNEEGRIESLNSAASRMFGYEPADVVGLRLDSLLETTDDGKGSGARWDGDALSVARGSLRELTGKRKDGSSFPLEISVSEMSLGRKKVYIVMVRDNTQRKKAENALLNSQKQIIKQEKLVSLGTMVAGIAHEINNPAQAISFSMEGLKMNIGYVRELLDALQPCLETDDAELPPACRQLKEKAAELRLDLVLRGINDIAERNIESIERIEHIINSTKRMAHSDEQFAPCDINTIVNDAITLTHNQIKYCMNLETDLAPDLPRIKGLAQELGQVFINMIINARDAVQARGLSKKEALIRVSTAYHPERQEIEVRFEDNGIGISQDILDNIFDPFFTTKGVGKGMGLGLNLCHRIVEAHGGEIRVESVVGEGTTFILILKAGENQRA